MHVKTRGLVLQVVKYSETSLIARVFTEQLGLVSYMVNGVRSSKNLQKAAMLRPLSLLEMDVTHRENKSLQRIKEFKRAHRYMQIPFDTVKACVSLFLLEVIMRTLRDQDPHEALFEFVYKHLLFIDAAEKLAPDFHLQFLLHYTQPLGFFPQAGYSATTPCFSLPDGCFVSRRFASGNVLNETTSTTLAQMMAQPATQPLPENLTRAQRKDVLLALIRYYQFHIEGFGQLKSHEVLETVFE